MKLLLIIGILFSFIRTYSIPLAIHMDSMSVNSPNKIDSSIKMDIHIEIKEPLSIQELKNKTITPWDWVIRIGAILGIIAGVLGLILTVATINEKLFLRPKVISSLIGYTSSFIDNINLTQYDGTEKAIGPGIKYLVKLSLNVINHDLNFKVVDIVIKYTDDPKVYTTLKSYTSSFRKWIWDGIEKTLELSINELLNYKTNLERNKTHHLYLLFFIADSKFSNNGNLNDNYKYPVYIKLKFTLSKKSHFFNNHKVIETNEMKLTDIQPWEYIVDDSIWKPTSA